MEFGSPDSTMFADVFPIADFFLAEELYFLYSLYAS